MRALIVVRLSRVTDATTSPERQLEICEELCRQRGYDVVGIAQDLDVSGAVDPFDKKKRPNLARWLAGEHTDEAGNPAVFDVIVAYRVDRLTRSIRHLRKLVDWAEDNDKLVVSATEPHFDMTSPFAAVLIALIGTVAEMELAAISERNASSKRRDIRLGKYRGGTPPWGYRPERDGDGVWRLVHDVEQVKVIHEVVRRVLAGDPLNRVAHDLTRRGIPTVKDRAAQLQGKPMKGTGWNVTPLKRSLLSEAMLGYAVSGGKPIRSEDGSPVVRSEPILDRKDFDALRVELSSRSKRGDPTKRSTSLLLRVIHCGVCGEPAYRFNGGSHSQYPRYRCRSMSKTTRCGNRTVRLDEADSAVADVILSMIGDSERLERQWDSGSDNSAELAELDAELIDVTSLIGTPAYRAGTPQRTALDARIESLAARQAELSKESVVPAGWTWQPTGELFADWWERQDVTARNVWLRSMGIRLDFDRTGLRLDLGDLQTLTGQLRPDGAVAEWQRTFDALTANGIAGIEIGTDRNYRVHLQDGSVVLVDSDGNVQKGDG
ncbi:recombinase family protein [Mycolicibacter kumamotonensis]|uniref:recombinase family protein n=1 Tax=Mycolicibacter kumamotonensis TaxID=354243 RepID=UPI0008066A1A|nr:recombinase family protein [Mycolicibacter kumamotonensis]